MRPQPLICVRDVESSSRWYQRLLDCQSGHGGTQYEQLVSHEQNGRFASRKREPVGGVVVEIIASRARCRCVVYLRVDDASVFCFGLWVFLYRLWLDRADSQGYM